MQKKEEEKKIYLYAAFYALTAGRYDIKPSLWLVVKTSRSCFHKNCDKCSLTSQMESTRLETKTMSSMSKETTKHNKEWKYT